jgi:hypothetical protein
VHTDQHLGGVAFCGFDRTDRVHHVIRGWSVSRSLAAGENDRHRRLKHERECGRRILHRVGAVHDDDAVRAGGDLLVYRGGELLPHVGLHILREDVGDNPAAVVGTARKLGDSPQHVLGGELCGDRAGAVINCRGDSATGRNKRDRR